MAVLMASGHPAPGGLMLRGRDDERAVLDRLLEEARVGQSGVLVLRGEAGVGKTALLEHAIESASDLTVVRAVGVESEMELAYAALHQLSATLLDRVDQIPAPQRDALETTFGLRERSVPDRFLVGLATLSLLSEAAQERPLVCAIDDAQWLDRASAQVLAFVARRLLAESVVLVLATREPTGEFGQLPELVVEGLRDAEARALLASAIPGGWTIGWQINCWWRHAATRSPCWSCRGDRRRRSWRAASGCRERCRCRCRAGSRRAS
jgi:hypothetical protein